MPTRTATLPLTPTLIFFCVFDPVSLSNYFGRLSTTQNVSLSYPDISVYNLIDVARSTAAPLRQVLTTSEKTRKSAGSTKYGEAWQLDLQAGRTDKAGTLNAAGKTAALALNPDCQSTSDLACLSTVL
jgi:hypothetical protein